jgi:hypothetical protein
MFRRIAVAGLAALAIGAGGGAGVAAHAAAPSLDMVPSSWAPSDNVHVMDVFAVGRQSWVVGDLENLALWTPIVQHCTAVRCTKHELPTRAGTTFADVESISGTSAKDIWAVGSTQHGETNIPTTWHYNGKGWTRVKARGVQGDVNLYKVVAVSHRESWALGDLDYGSNGTNTVYHRVGRVWHEVSPLDSPTFPNRCASWYTNQWNDLAVVGHSVALVGYCEDVPSVITQRRGGWVDIAAGLPSGYWNEAASIDGRLWVAGRDSMGANSIMQREHGSWSAISTRGLPGNANVEDLAGQSHDNLWMVGWVPTAPGSQAASWHWRAGRWDSAAVPTNADHRTILSHASVAGEKAWAVGTDLTGAPKGLVFQAR